PAGGVPAQQRYRRHDRRRAALRRWHRHLGDGQDLQRGGCANRRESRPDHDTRRLVHRERDGPQPLHSAVGEVTAMLQRLLTASSVIVLLAAPAAAQTFNSGSTEADGDFSPRIRTPGTLPASGVFNYRTVTIPAGVVVRYRRNAANTPVTILATGNVIIAGTIDVTGAAGGNIALNTTNVAPNGGVGGPGGFDGGAGSNGIVTTTGGSGLGPGGGAGGPGGSAGGGGFVNAGGNAQGGGSGAGGTPYGTPQLLPLIGGSGGGGGGAGLPPPAGGGGGGGGALIVASSGTITLTGSVLATGGAGGGNPINLAGAGAGGGGTGGAVRLLATAIAGTGGSINVNGQPGGG